MNFLETGKYLKTGVKKSQEPEYLVQIKYCWNKILWLLLSYRTSGLKLTLFETDINLNRKVK